MASAVKNQSADAGNARDVGLIPELGRSPGGGNGNPLPYSCLRNPMDRGSWWAAVHGVTVRHDRVTEHAFVFTLSLRWQWLGVEGVGTDGCV